MPIDRKKLYDSLSKKSAPTGDRPAAEGADDEQAEGDLEERIIKDVTAAIRECFKNYAG